MNEFDAELRNAMPEGLHTENIDILQINLGRKCSLSCQHCHLKCSPERSEEMTLRTMEKIADIVKQHRFQMIDITGGCPEIHPHFKEFVRILRDDGAKVQLRTNLVSLTEAALKGTAEFLSELEIALVASMPCYLEENVRAQRGAGVYEKSVSALQLLNSLGYGMDENLPLTLVYNPGGPFLPGKQSELENAYRHELAARFGIRFTRLLTITNMPIGRFGQALNAAGELENYMALLKNSFNSATLNGLMCRHQVCIDWDGRLYDCDFNIALGLTVNHGAPDRLENFDPRLLEHRKIVTGMHCYGCTAGAGSSCGGAICNCDI